MSNQKVFLRTTLAAALATQLAMPLMAQEATAPPADVDQEAEATQLDRIVVTAQKRLQGLEEVPVTVSVVTAQQLEAQNITSVQDLERAVPTFTRGLTGAGVRGVSTGGFARSSEQAVSTVLDGVVMGDAAGSSQISNLFDIERVEVLSGPQGTLFGKNASAGVISIVTKRPRFDTFEVSGGIDYGNYGHERARAVLNTPVGENSALRLLGFHARDEEVIRNTVTGDRVFAKSWGGRLRYLWQPTDSLEINLIADYTRGSGDGIPPLTYAYIPDPAGANAPVVDLLAACGITNVSTKNTLNCVNPAPQAAQSERSGGSIQFDYTFDNDSVLTSITAKRRHQAGPDFGDFRPGGDIDATTRNILDWSITPSEFDVFTQELRLTSPANRTFEYVAGLYYYDEQKHVDVYQAGQLGFDTTFAAVGYPSNTLISRFQPVHVDSRSTSVFGQATYYVNDKLSFLFGGRYTRDRLRDDAYNASLAELATIAAGNGYFVPTAPNPILVAILGADPVYDLALGFANGFVTVNETIEENNFSWRLGSQYQFSDDVMGFATATRGYKGPAVNDQGASLDPIIRAEKPLSFELGLKATSFNGKLFTGLTFFHTKVDDYQTQVFYPGGEFFPAGFTQGNAPYMKTRGIELSFVGRPFKGFTFNGGAVYTRATYSPDFRVACGPEQVPGDGRCETVGGSNISPPVSQIPYTPKFKLVLNGEYVWGVGSNLDGFVQSDFQYQTSTYTSSSYDPRLTTPNTFFLNGRFGVRSKDGRWSASLWGRNLLGESYTVWFPAFIGFVPGFDGVRNIAPTRVHERTYGISVDFKF